MWLNLQTKTVYEGGWLLPRDVHFNGDRVSRSLLELAWPSLLVVHPEVVDVGGQCRSRKIAQQLLRRSIGL